MQVPGARFSRAIGHKAGLLFGVMPGVQVTHRVIEDKDLMKIKVLAVSSQLYFVSKNTKFRELFINFKSTEEDLKAAVLGAMKGLDKNEQLLFSDFGLVYAYQN